MLLVRQAAAEHERPPRLPPPRHIVPAAVVEIFRAGPVDHELPVDRRLIVAFEEVRVARFEPLRLLHDADQVPAPFGLDEREGLAPGRRVLAAPQRVELALIRLSCDRDEQHLGLHADAAVHPRLGVQLDLRRLVERHREVAIVHTVGGAEQQGFRRRLAPGVAEEVARGREYRRLRVAIPVGPQHDVAVLAHERLGGRETQAHDPPRPINLEGRRRLARLERHLRRHRLDPGAFGADVRADVLAGGGEQRPGLLDPRTLRGARFGGEGLDAHAVGVRRVVDLIELHPLGADGDLARLGVGQRDVAVETAGAEADQRPRERRMRAHEQLAELDADSRLALAVEVELHHVIGRRGRPDAIDHAGPFEVGQHQPARLLPHERELPAEPVVVAPAPVVARHRRDADRFAKHRQPVQPIQLLDPRNPLAPRRARCRQHEQANDQETIQTERQRIAHSLTSLLRTCS